MVREQSEARVAPVRVQRRAQPPEEEQRRRRAAAIAVAAQWAALEPQQSA